MMIKVENTSKWVEVLGSISAESISGEWKLRIGAQSIRTYDTEAEAVSAAEAVATTVGVLAL